MLKFLTDECFKSSILRGLLRRKPDLDIVRVQDVGLIQTEDPKILEWAAQENRIMLTHDVQTMTNFAFERVKAGLPMPGVFEVNSRIPVGVIIEEIIMLAECSLEGEWEGRVEYLPLK